MSDADERAAVRWVNRGHDLAMFVDALHVDVRHALYTLLNARIASSWEKHDHPPRPTCWACGSHQARIHADTCHAMLSVALAAVDWPDHDRRHGDRSNRSYYGEVLERGRSAGANMKALRRDEDAIERWTGDEPP